jgi:hypothetical protein
MRTRTSALAATAALILAGVATGTAAATPATPPAGAHAGAASGSGLTVPALPSGQGSLFGAVHPDAHTTWAFGFSFGPDAAGATGIAGPLLLADDDRDSKGWHTVPLAPSTTHSRINAMAVAPAGTSNPDAWLVGDATNAQDGILTEHWDGTAWKQISVPLPAGASSGGLLSVSERSPDDVWAAGWAEVDKGDEATQRGLVEHWNGRTWKKVAIPQPGKFLTNSVVALGPDDVWAVGTGGNYKAGDPTSDQPMAEHWNGTAWTAATLPSTGGRNGELTTIVVDGSGTLWAGGRNVLDDKDSGHALLLRDTGGTWQQVAVPDSTSSLTSLAPTPGGVTVVSNLVTDIDTPVVLRLNGDQWRSVDLPQPPNGSAYSLIGVSATTAGPTLVGEVDNIADSSQFPSPLVITSS